jgi:hypothetical protein
MSTSSKFSSLKKPSISTDATLAFAEGGTGASSAPTTSGKGRGAARSETAPAGQKSGFVPEGDVRLTANIRGDLHIKLKIRAAQERTTVGELIEQWIESWP